MAGALHVIRPGPTPPGLPVSVLGGVRPTLWALWADLTKANLIGANLDRTSEKRITSVPASEGHPQGSATRGSLLPRSLGTAIGLGKAGANKFLASRNKLVGGAPSTGQGASEIRFV